MIDTQQTVLIRTTMEEAWDFASDIRRWADLVPGMQSCDVLDDDTSRWVVKVGVGGLVRTVTVDVHVQRWAGPDAVDFTYKLKGDPVTGDGSYRAVPVAEGTDVTLALRVNGTGPMAPMWEAMGRPVLPQLAKGFAVQLKEAVERTAGVASAPADVGRGRSWLSRLIAWARGWMEKGRQAT